MWKGVREAAGRMEGWRARGRGQLGGEGRPVRYPKALGAEEERRVWTCLSDVGAANVGRDDEVSGSHDGLAACRRGHGEGVLAAVTGHAQVNHGVPERGGRTLVGGRRGDSREGNENGQRVKV